MKKNCKTEYTFILSKISKKVAERYNVRIEVCAPVAFYSIELKKNKNSEKEWQDGT